MTKDKVVKEALSLLAIASALGFLTFGYLLSTGRVPVGSGLYALYFGYAFCGIVSCHLWFFILNSILRNSRSKHRKRLPKYIEYFYAAILSIGLAQVFMSSTRLVDYLLLAVGNEESIANKIQAVARGYMAKECVNAGTNRYFTKDYCAKVKSLAEATDPKEYVVSEVVADKAFLSHTINIIAPGGPGGIVYVQSPIADYVNQLSALRGYSALPTPVGLGNAFSWIALLLLPIAIALRLTKTSLELYGGDDLPDPDPA